MSDHEYIIGALSDKAGGVVFNNRVLVDNSLHRNVSVIFHNYLRERVGFRGGEITFVNFFGFIRKLTRKRPSKIWVHTSELARFYFYYLFLLPVAVFSGSRINAVFHSGAIRIRFVSRLPKVDIHLLDYRLYESFRSRSNVYCFKDRFVEELNAYLAREEKLVPEMSDRIAEIVCRGAYVVTTGYINPTYNFNAIIKAYNREAKKDISLVVLSYGEFEHERYAEEFFDLVESPGVFHLRDVARSDYVHLLSNCAGLIRATPWDSFGIVMYEAHHFGVPVFASRIANFRPDFVHLFDLEELSRMGLVRLMSDFN